MARWFSTRELARVSAHHPWPVDLGWIAVILIAIIFGLPNFGSVLTSDLDLEKNPESVVGEQVIEDAGLTDQVPSTASIVIQS